MVSYVVVSPDDSEGVVLAKVMEVAKEIRSDDKKRGAAPAGGLAADSLLWVPERQGGRAAAGAGGAVGCVQGGGVMVCRGWMGRAMVRRQFGYI